jgi:thiamine kinase-like enzyme
VLCHHDPHLGNVIGEPGVLIDWEYAALGHPLFDLAFVIEYHALDGQAESALLAGWAGEDPPVSLQPLGDFRELVAGVNDLWLRAIDACV